MFKARFPTDGKKFDVNWPGPDNLFGYTGLGYDYYSGLTNARARYYKPELGRFVSEDTYKGTLESPQSQNLYAYVQNNPLKYIDPSGHMATKQLNDYAEQYINNELDTEELVESMIKWNGSGQIFLSFHEIAQVIVANN